ncbi:MAG: ATP synthase F1 subunit epsilon [Patescibacteria group bacterium]
MQIKVTTPEGVIFEDEVDSATIPTQMGEITILQNHIPLVSALAPGEIILKKNNKEEYLSAGTGFIEVNKNKITILADTAETVASLVEEEILKAKERAEKLLQEKRNVSEVAFVEAAAALEREMSRLKIYRRRKASGKGVHISQE